MLDAELLSATYESLRLLRAVIADAANRPKEALQAARLLVQKSGWKTLLHAKRSATSANDRQETERMLAEIKQLDAGLQQMLGSLTPGHKKPPLNQRMNGYLPKR